MKTVAYLDSYVSGVGLSNLKLYVTIEPVDGYTAVDFRNRVRLRTGISIPPADWNKDEQRVLNTNKKAKEYNLILNQKKALLNDIFIKYHLNKKKLTPDILKAEYENPSKGFDFLDWISKEIKERSGTNISTSTAKQHFNLVNHLAKFKKIIDFADVDEKFIDDFEKHLIRNKLGINSRHKLLRNLKVYINIAIRRDIISRNPFLGKRIKQARTTIEFLTQEELDRLMDLYKNAELKPAYQSALRVFLFGYWQCGLRISDVKRITHENIVGKDFVITPRKTKLVNNNVIIMPISPIAMQLAADAHPGRKQGLVIDTFSEQVINRFLKQVAKHALIPKSINMKMARHSFATHFLQKTKDLATLQQLLGHASITQTMVYAHVTNEEKHAQYQKFMGD